MLRVMARAVHRVHTSLWLRRPLSEVFPFFADARNLERITPPWLQFQVLASGAIEMREGVTIDYRLRLRGIPIRWTSRIAAWEPPYRFVDAQDRGPYRTWHHEHRFREDNGVTVAEDEVAYTVPGGSLVNRFFVAPDLRRVFAYRCTRLREIFHSPADDRDFVRVE